MSKALRFLGWPVLVGVLLALLIIQRNPELVGLSCQEVHVEQAPLPSRLQEGPMSYANAVSRAAPVAVSLYAVKMVSKPSHPLFDDPMFRRFLGDNLPQQKRMESNLGSAAIMSAEGYLLANNHVTAGADQIIVALRDGRKTIAQLVGSNLKTGLAVLKIDLKNLPATTLGRSDGIRTGDVCLVIGNLFGVGQTVITGIISATGRNQFDLNTYEDFIQTDAAINPGNSGGALVDTVGNLIGINAATFSESGGSQGIGFVISTKPALEVMQSIIEHGQVIRGQPGVEVKALITELVESLGLGEIAGIVVTGIYRGGLAVRDGLLPGDVILTIDKQEVSDGHRSMNQVAYARPEQKISIMVLRNGQEVNLIVEAGLRLPSAPALQQEQDGGEQSPPPKTTPPGAAFVSLEEVQGVQ